MTQVRSTYLYDSDSVAWADQQALLLEQERFAELDLINLVEEVRDLVMVWKKCLTISFFQTEFDRDSR